MSRLARETEAFQALLEGAPARPGRRADREDYCEAAVRRFGQGVLNVA